MKKYKSLFEVEHLRDKLAKNNKLNEFRKTYSKNYPELTNLNTKQFWNSNLDSLQSLKNQDGMTKDRIKTAVKFLPSSSTTVLDIGVGFGYLEEKLHKNKNLNLFGNDIASKSITRIKNKFKGEYRVNSIYSLSYPKNKFDAIFILEVLEHIPPSKLFKVLSDTAKILKNRGYLIVSVPLNEGLEKMKINPSGHVRAYTENIIKAELKLAGFTILKQKKFYAFKNYYFIKKNLATFFKNKWEPNNIIILARKK